MNRSAIFAAVLALCSTGFAQTILYNDFSSTAGLTINGNAAAVGNVMRVTPSAMTQAGSFWIDQRVLVQLGFDATFNFQLSNPLGGGADGLAFIIHNDPNGDTYIGGPGTPMGYGAPPSGGAGPISSLVIELDTWNSGNLAAGGTDLPSGNEISIHTNGAGATSESELLSIAQIDPGIILEDGAIHAMRVNYVPGTLEVYLDNMMMPLISVPFSFENGGTWINGAMNGVNSGTVPTPNGSAWVGFCSGTGGASLDHDVLAFQMTSIAPDPCFAGTVGVGAGGPFDLLLINGSAGGFSRTVVSNTFTPLSFDMLQPATNPNPAPFIIFGAPFFPTPATAFPSAFGTFCIPPSLFSPLPGLFILADSFSNPAAFLQAGPSPWNFTYFPGVPIPFQMTIQGIIVQNNQVSGNVAVTNAVQLDVVNGPPPVITAVTPLSAPANALVTVSGTGFVLAGLQMDLDGVAISPVNVSPTQIDFAMPPGAACDATLTIQNIDGQSTSMLINPQPVITGSFLGTGPAAGGASFIISGTGFSPGMTVTMGGNAATISTQSGTSMIVITAPGTSMTTVPVVITSGSGCTAMTTYNYN